MFRVVNEPQPVPWESYSTPLIVGGVGSYTTALWPCIVLLILSTALLGIFTAQSLFAAFVLVHKGLRNASVTIVLATVLIMYGAAALHWAILLLNVIGYYNVAEAYAAQLLCQCTNRDVCRGICPAEIEWSYMEPPSCSFSSFGIPGTVHGLTVCAPTIILMINVVLGDAIVWWRVCVIWPRSLIVRTACVILLGATTGMSAIDTIDSCPRTAFYVLSVFNFTDVPLGTFFQSDLYGLAASVLSLASNMIATILIACKAWEQRKIMRKVSLKTSSQVEKALIFLVESGTIYCFIWAAVLAYQIALLTDTGVVSSPEQKALTAFDYFIKGCLIPIIGIYPTVIITIVALNKSHFSEASFEGNIVSTLSFGHPMSSTIAGSSSESLPSAASSSNSQVYRFDEQDRDGRDER